MFTACDPQVSKVLLKTLDEAVAAASKVSRLLTPLFAHFFVMLLKTLDEVVAVAVASKVNRLVYSIVCSVIQVLAA